MSSNRKALCILLSAVLLCMAVACTAKTQGASVAASSEIDGNLSAVSDDTASTSILSSDDYASLPASSSASSASLPTASKQENSDSKSVTSHKAEEIHFQVKTINKNTIEDNIKIETSIPLFSGFSVSSELNKKLSKIVEDRLQENKNYIKTLGEEFRKGFWINSSFEYNQSGNILSVWLTVDDYTGGAHDYKFIRAFNVNMKTGEFYNAPYSMFEDKSAAKNEITDKVIQEISGWQVGSYLVKESVKTIKNKDGNFQFYIDKNNLVIYFDPYELFNGIPTFSLPLSSLQSKLVN